MNDTDAWKVQVLQDLCFGAHMKKELLTDGVNYHHLFYTKDRLVVGYAYKKYVEHPNPYKKATRISWLCVHPKYRKQGIAEAIVTQLINSNAFYTTTIKNDNVASINLFRKLRFTVDDSLPVAEGKTNFILQNRIMKHIKYSIMSKTFWTWTGQYKTEGDTHGN